MVETYCTLTEVDDYATNNGESQWLSTKTGTDKERTRLLVMANNDIVRYIGALNYDLSLIQPDDNNIKRASILHTIYIQKVVGVRESAEQLKQLTSGSINDGVLDIEGLPSHDLNDDAKFYADRFKYEFSDLIQSLSPKTGFGR